MGLELKRSLELFFSKNLKQTIAHTLPQLFVLAHLLLTLKEHL